MDFLSTSPSLSSILSLLEAKDVMSCIAVNRRMNQVILNNWRLVKKPTADLTFNRNVFGWSIVIMKLLCPISRRAGCAVVDVQPDCIIIPVNCYPLIVANTQIAVPVVYMPQKYLKLPVESLCEGLRLLLKCFLPRMNIDRFVLAYSNMEAAPSEQQTMVDSLREYYRGSCCKFHYKPYRFDVNPLFVETELFLGKPIIENTIDYFKSIAGCMSILPLDRNIVHINILGDLWCPEVLSTLLQAWTRGERSILSLEIRCRPRRTLAGIDNWQTLCVLLNVVANDNESQMPYICSSFELSTKFRANRLNVQYCDYEHTIHVHEFVV